MAINLPDYQPFTPPPAPSAPPGLGQPMQPTMVSAPTMDMDIASAKAPPDPRMDMFRDFAIKQGNDPGRVDSFLNLAKTARDAQYQQALLNAKIQQNFTLGQAGLLKQQDINITNDPANVGKEAASAAYKTGETTTAAGRAQNAVENETLGDKMAREKQEQAQKDQLALAQAKALKEQEPDYKTKSSLVKNGLSALEGAKTALTSDPGILRGTSNSLLKSLGFGQKKAKVDAQMSQLSTAYKSALGQDIPPEMKPMVGDSSETITAKMDAIKSDLLGSGYAPTSVASSISPSSTSGSNPGGVPAKGLNFSSGASALAQPDAGRKLLNMGMSLNPVSLVGNAVNNLFVKPAGEFAKGVGQAAGQKANTSTTNKIQQTQDAQNKIIDQKLKVAIKAGDRKKVQEIAALGGDYNQRAAALADEQIARNSEGIKNTKQGATTAANVAMLIPGAQVGRLGKIGLNLASGAGYGLGASAEGKEARDTAIGAGVAGGLHLAGAGLSKLFSPKMVAAPLSESASTTDKFIHTIDNIDSASAKIPRTFEGRTIQNTLNLSPKEAKLFRAPAMTEKLAQNGFTGLPADQMHARAQSVVDATTKIVKDAVGSATPVQPHSIRVVAEQADNLLEEAQMAGITEKQADLIRTQLHKGLEISKDMLPDSLDPTKVGQLQKKFQALAERVSPGNQHASELKSTYRGIARELSESLHDAIQASPDAVKAVESVKTPEVQQVLRQQGLTGLADDFLQAKGYQDIRHALEPFVKGTQMLDILENKGPKGAGVRRAMSQTVGALVGGIIGHGPGAVVGQAVAPSFEPLMDSVTSSLQPRISGTIARGVGTTQRGLGAVGNVLQNKQVQRGVSTGIEKLNGGGGKPGMNIKTAIPKYPPKYLYK